MKNQFNVQQIKNYFSQKTVLILGIVSLIPIITSFVASILASSGLSEFLNDITKLIHYLEIDIDDSINLDLVDNINDDYGITIPLIQLIFYSLIPATWFFIYFRSKSSNPNKTPYAGLFFFYIIYIIKIVILAFFILFSLAFSGIFIFFIAININPATAYDENMFAFVVFMLIAIYLFLLGWFSLLYSIYGMKFFGATQKSLTSQNMIDPGKGFGILLIIRATLIILFVVSIIIVGFLSPSISDLFDLTFTETATLDSLIDSLIPAVILSAISTFISALPYIFEAKIALCYCRMAKSVPPTPNQYNPYNSYNQNNQFNQNNSYDQGNQYNPYNQVPPQQ